MTDDENQGFDRQQSERRLVLVLVALGGIFVLFMLIVLVVGRA
jgi:hypothetical protein